MTDAAPDRQLVSSGSPYEPTIGFSRAVRVGNQVFVSGTAPVWPDGSVDPDPLAQCRRVWEIALGALEQAGGTPANVVRTRQFITGPEIADAAGTAHGEIFGEIRPASTMVVTRLLDERWVVEVELDAVL
ncbi:MAG TPA: RidA family protein [Nocardioidaceae bacterium]|nr:RidA family protein [Nocardioidaceae bacterium]